jgi:hypothetical protein
LLDEAEQRVEEPGRDGDGLTGQAEPPMNRVQDEVTEGVDDKSSVGAVVFRSFQKLSLPY